MTSKLVNLTVLERLSLNQQQVPEQGFESDGDGVTEIDESSDGRSKEERALNHVIDAEKISSMTAIP